MASKMLTVIQLLLADNCLTELHAFWITQNIPDLENYSLKSAFEMSATAYRFGVWCTRSTSLPPGKGADQVQIKTGQTDTNTHDRSNSTLVSSSLVKRNR